MYGHWPFDTDKTLFLWNHLDMIFPYDDSHYMPGPCHKTEFHSIRINVLTSKNFSKLSGIRTPCCVADIGPEVPLMDGTWEMYRIRGTCLFSPQILMEMSRTHESLSLGRSHLYLWDFFEIRGELYMSRSGF